LYKIKNKNYIFQKLLNNYDIKNKLAINLYFLILQRMEMYNMEETDLLKIMRFDSSFDNSKKEMLLALPLRWDINKRYNLIISPHFFGATYFENYYLGAASMIEPFKGWQGIASKYNVLIAIPLGHGRVLDRISLAYEGQMKDLSELPYLLELKGYKIGKVYAGGISMGGMETLTLVGKYPKIFTAAFSYNGIADLSSWYEDIIAGKTDKKMIDMSVPKLIIEEIGSTPQKNQEEYLKRSAINYIENLSKVPIMIYWSEKDSIVVNQQTKQTKMLADKIRLNNPKAEIFDYNHTNDHGFKYFNAEERIKCHEFCDFEQATKWLLNY